MTLYSLLQEARNATKCVFPFTFQDDYNSESLKRDFAANVNSFKETRNRGLLGFPNLDAAKKAILDILLTADEYNLGEKTTMYQQF